MANTSIFARLGLDTSQFQTGLRTARRSATNFTRGVGGQFAAAAGIAGMGAMVNKGVQLGGTLSDLSAQLRINVEDLQVLQFAAQEAGVESSILERGLRNLQLRTQEATEGNQSYADAFDALGLNMFEFNALPTEEKFVAIAEAAQDATDENEAYNAVAILVGQRAGPALTEVLGRVAHNYDNVKQAAHDAGQVMTRDTAESMDRVADNAERLNTRFTIIAANVTNFVLPVFTLLGNGLGIVFDVVGALGAGFYSSMELVGRSVSTVIQPAIRGFQALAVGIEGTYHAINRDWGEANEAFDDAASLAAQARQDFVDIPAEMGEHWQRFQSDVEASGEVMSEAFMSRAEENAEALDNLMGQESERQEQLREDREQNEAEEDAARAADAERIAAERQEGAALAALEEEHHRNRIAMARASRAEALEAAQAYRDDTMAALEQREEIERRMGIVLEGSDDDIARLIELEQQGIITGRSLREQERLARQEERQLRADTAEAARLQAQFNQTWLNMTAAERQAARERQEQLQDFSGDLAGWTDDQLLNWTTLEEAAGFVEDAAESMTTSTSGLADAAVDVVDAVNELNRTMDAPPSEWQWLAQRQDQIITHLESIDTEVNRNP